MILIESQKSYNKESVLMCIFPNTKSEDIFVKFSNHFIEFYGKNILRTFHLSFYLTVLIFLNCAFTFKTIIFLSFAPFVQFFLKALKDNNNRNF